MSEVLVQPPSSTWMKGLVSAERVQDMHHMVVYSLWGGTKGTKTSSKDSAPPWKFLRQESSGEGSESLSTSTECRLSLLMNIFRCDIEAFISFGLPSSEIWFGMKKDYICIIHSLPDMLSFTFSPYNNVVVVHVPRILLEAKGELNFVHRTFWMLRDRWLWKNNRDDC